MSTTLLPAMEPFSLALDAFFRGEEAATLIMRMDDGSEVRLPIRHFFRSADEFTAIERRALHACRGRVLDGGAGTGLHALELQRRGLEVRAVDLSPAAVKIMRRRRVRDVRRADLLTLEDGPFDTVLLLGHGIGMTGDLRGLDAFLRRARRLLNEGGRLLLHSVEVTVSDDPRHCAYHEANRRAGRYVGETRMQFEFAGIRGPFFPWLHVDPRTLEAHAAGEGLGVEVLLQEATGEYLAAVGR